MSKSRMSKQERANVDGKIPIWVYQCCKMEKKKCCEKNDFHSSSLTCQNISAIQIIALYLIAFHAFYEFSFQCSSSPWIVFVSLIFQMYTFSCSVSVFPLYWNFYDGEDFSEEIHSLKGYYSNYFYLLNLSTGRFF